MADEHKAKRLEIAHVLFIDIVGYSKLLIDEQSEALEELNQIVRSTEAFRSADVAGKLICLPTGDGMALVFTNSAEAPVECALQISKALKSHSSLAVRMGIHSGPVHEVADVNQRKNIAGAGINIAQRVMDCGDAGHILLSKHVTGVAAIHYPLRNVDTRAGDILALIYVSDFMDRTTVNAHSDSEARVRLQRLADLQSTFHRCFCGVCEDQCHAIAGRETNELPSYISAPKCFGTSHDL